MTDPFTVLREADPAAGGAPDPATRERMDAEIERLLASEPEPRADAAPRARTAGRSRRALAVAGAAATIAVAGGLAALPSGDGASPIAPAPANAAEALRQLGTTAANASTPDGRYLYEHTLSYTTHMRPARNGTFFATVVPTDIETWFARDGSERIEHIREAWDKAIYPTARDRAYAEAIGPLQPSPGAGAATRYTDTKVAGLTVAELQALPTDPVALRASLKRVERFFPPSPRVVVTVTGLVLRSPLTPPAVRAAAFELLRGLPGAQLVPGAKDPTGRGGSAVEFDGDAWRTMFIFDPKTSALIATRSIGKKELPGRNIRDWILQLDSRATDSAPAARASTEIDVTPTSP